MKYLLDAAPLIALIWPSHVHHRRTRVWRSGKTIVLCPISELAFLRVSTSVAFNASMADARQALMDFLRDEQPEFLPADLRALEGDPAPTSAKSTDWYLANLAAHHGLKLATLDESITHGNAELIPALPTPI